MSEHAIQAAQRCFSEADRLRDYVMRERRHDPSAGALLRKSDELEAEAIAHLCKHCGVKRREA